MSIKTKLQKGLDRLMSEASREIQIQKFNQIYDSVYDEPVSLVQTGSTVFTRGIILPIDSRTGTSDALLLEQGKIANSDLKLFISGGTSMENNNTRIKVTIGSPTGDAYTIISAGVITPQVEGTEIYKKVYLRRLTGSMI